jgi:hypothetical protein
MWEMTVLSHSGKQIGKPVDAMLWDYNDLIQFILSSQEINRTVLINGENVFLSTQEEGK